MTQTLVADALRAAYWRNKPKPGLLGVASIAVMRALQASYGIQTSMSRKGHCWERAACPWGAMRRWKVSSTLKTERLHHYRFATREQARQTIFEYIEVFYSRTRRHANIGNQIPANFAKQFYADSKMATSSR